MTIMLPLVARRMSQIRYSSSEEQVIVESNSKVSGFKKRFKNLSNEEIERRLNQNLVPEALVALKQLWRERTHQNNE